MRKRILRITATAGATALLATVGAIAATGTASAATAPTAHALAAHHTDCWMGSDPNLPPGHPEVWMCHGDDDGLLGGLLDALLG